ncbi:transmembrane E3 ubiquitin-protein ligase, partial [Tremellales sp. Uapishka_1]
MSDPAPSSPRSPRPEAERTGAVAPPPGLPPGALVGMTGPPPPPRASLSSMLLLTAFFFLMSGGNTAPEQIIIGPDGEVTQRLSELELSRTMVKEYRGWMNGTGNWTEPPIPSVSPSSLIPPEYTHRAEHYFTNITGFYRKASAHPISLLDSARSIPSFFYQVDLPTLNTSLWNETRAVELRGAWDWANMTSFEMNVKERRTEAEVDDWTWVKGAATLGANEHTIDYDLYGLHFVPNGTYNLFALPDGIRIDIRNIPRLYPDHHNITSRIILAELKKEMKKQESALMLSEVKDDDETATSCPLLLYLTLPPLPPGWTAEEIAAYESELHNPTGIRTSLRKPPNYWGGLGLGGVAIADECGWAFGISDGAGVKLDDFWRKSVNYAAYATFSQLLVLILLVRQMEFTRTPSTLSKVSLWTIVMMGTADSWIFSAHVVVGIMSENKTSLPMLVPGFLCLCTAIVFGPRYAVLLHRIQAPERIVSPAPVIPRPAPAPAPNAPISETGQPAVSPSAPLVVAGASDTPFRQVVTIFRTYPTLKWTALAACVFLAFQIALLPSVVPFFLFAMYSFWIPQIYRNARKGNAHALQTGFVVGTSLARLALPLYAFGCPDNVFFIENSQWVWTIVVWLVIQVGLLFAQERFGGAFFLPKRFAPAETYNYHPVLPPADAENPSHQETTCSICMEEVNTHPGPSSEALLGLNARRAYALAPCHHLFHTKCLSQWLAIKTICPLCKRPLPPL